LGNWRWRRFCLEHHRFNTTIIQDGAMREYHFHILQSVSRRALYIGVTNNLRHHVFQHKNHPFEGFTDDYNAIRVVYWEHFDSVGKAIAREKQLKRWRREKEDLAGRENEPRVERSCCGLVRNARSLDSGARPPDGRAPSLEMTVMLLTVPTNTRPPHHPGHPERDRSGLGG
jgi:putative endonuclease